MAAQTVVKMGTIICQECEKEIAAVENVNSVKTWYGICKECADKKRKE